MSLFKQAVKVSFKHVKQDIENLENSIRQIKEVLMLQNQAMGAINEKIGLLLTKKDEKQEILPPKDEKLTIFHETTSSSGNNGVKQTNKQALSNQALSTKEEEIAFEEPKNPVYNEKIKQISTTLQAHKHNTKEKIVHAVEFRTLKKSITQLFQGLSKQELRTFLTIYQLEDEQEEASYEAIAAKMELSEACIRGYAANLVKKGIPVLKVKINNKKTLFRIDKEFRDLNLKQKLINLYYQQDLSQTQLFESL